MINDEDFEKNPFLNNKTVIETVKRREEEFKNKKYHPFKITFHLNRIIYLLKLSIISCAYASIYKANALDIQEVKYIDDECYDGENFDLCTDLIDLCIKLNETGEYQTVSCLLPCSFSLKDTSQQFDANLNPNPTKELAYFVEYELYGYGATGCNGGSGDGIEDYCIEYAQRRNEISIYDLPGSSQAFDDAGFCFFGSENCRMNTITLHDSHEVYIHTLNGKPSTSDLQNFLSQYSTKLPQIDYMCDLYNIPYSYIYLDGNIHLLDANKKIPARCFAITEYLDVRRISQGKVTQQNFTDDTKRLMFEDVTHAFQPLELWKDQSNYTFPCDAYQKSSFSSTCEIQILMNIGLNTQVQVQTIDIFDFYYYQQFLFLRIPKEQNIEAAFSNELKQSFSSFAYSKVQNFDLIGVSVFIQFQEGCQLKLSSVEQIQPQDYFNSTCEYQDYEATKSYLSYPKQTEKSATNMSWISKFLKNVINFFSQNWYILILLGFLILLVFCCTCCGNVCISSKQCLNALKLRKKEEAKYQPTRKDEEDIKANTTVQKYLR